MTLTFQVYLLREKYLESSSKNSLNLSIESENFDVNEEP